MSIDIGQLVLGRLVYVEQVAALDDVRFERIIRGFAQHYELTTHDAAHFSFARGEGYVRVDRGDAFGYIDGGAVERLRDGDEEIEVPGGNVVLLPPRFSAIRFTLNMRVILVYWAFALLVGWMLIGGAWIWWLAGFLAATGITVALVQRSLRAKLAHWLKRESWN